MIVVGSRPWVPPEPLARCGMLLRTVRSGFSRCLLNIGCSGRSSSESWQVGTTATSEQRLLWAGAKTRRVFRSGRRENAETGLVRAIIEWANLHQDLVPFIARLNAGIARSIDGRHVLKLAPKGSPDVIGCLATGRFLGAECKLPGEPVRSEQAARLEDIRSAGGLALVVSSVDEFADDVRRAIQEERS